MSRFHRQLAVSQAVAGRRASGGTTVAIWWPPMPSRVGSPGWACNEAIPAAMRTEATARPVKSVRSRVADEAMTPRRETERGESYAIPTGVGGRAVADLRPRSRNYWNCREFCKDTISCSRSDCER